MMNPENQEPCQDTRGLRAEAMTEQAEARIDQAKTRPNQAEGGETLYFSMPRHG
jgi:hypothetical protein